MTYSTLAIILRRRDIGEWDRLYIAYTRERGKLTLIGKGTRRPKAKLAAHLEPYAEVDLVIANGKAIDRITFARTIRAHASALRAWEDVQTAAFFAECVDQLTREGHRDVALFDLLRDVLLVFSSENLSLTHRPSSLITPFILRLLAILGYAPALDRCVECRTTITPGSAVGLPARAGLACNACAVSMRDGILITADDRELLALASAQFSPTLCAPALTAFAEAHLAHHLVAPLRTSVALSGLTGAPIPATLAGS